MIVLLDLALPMRGRIPTAPVVFGTLSRVGLAAIAPNLTNNGAMILVLSPGPYNSQNMEPPNPPNAKVKESLQSSGSIWDFKQSQSSRGIALYLTNDSVVLSPEPHNSVDVEADLAPWRQQRRSG